MLIIWQLLERVDYRNIARKKNLVYFFKAISPLSTNEKKTILDLLSTMKAV